ncbi:MAG: hypothetical protein AABY22_17700 [Nanoarchaeota archaeon]
MEETIQITSAKYLVCKNNKREYYITFYSHLWQEDVSEYAIFLCTPFSYTDSLKPAIFFKNTLELEFEMLKPKIRKVVDAFLIGNKEYKYWQVVMKENHKAILIGNCAESIADMIMNKGEILTKEALVIKIEELMSNTLL